MAKAPGNGKWLVQQYDHKGKNRPNDPPVDLAASNKEAVNSKKEVWSRLTINRNAEIDGTQSERYSGTVLLCIAPDNHGRVKVKSWMTERLRI